MTRGAVVFLSCSIAWLAADTARADTALQRYALIVGANFGGADRPLLKYGISDAERFARVMVDLGGVSPEHSTLPQAAEAARPARWPGPFDQEGDGCRAGIRCERSAHRSGRVLLRSRRRKGLAARRGPLLVPQPA